MAWGRDWQPTYEFGVRVSLVNTRQYISYGNIDRVRDALGLPRDPNNMLGRESYDRLIDRMLRGDLHDDTRLVVMGSPGTGKTMFFIYLILKRMAAKLPTAVQTSEDSFLVFDDHGPSLVLKSDDSLAQRLAQCWALTESNEIVNHPCEEFTFDAERVVYITSSKSTAWKEWAKYCYAVVVDLEPPSALDVAAEGYNNPGRRQVGRSDSDQDPTSSDHKTPVRMRRHILVT